MLTIEHLSVDYYRRGRGISAVRDFSLAIGPGQVVGLVGESGSGKSTVALAILRLIRPQEGRITAGRILFRPSSSPLVGEDKGGGAKTAGNPPSQPPSNLCSRSRLGHLDNAQALCLGPDSLPKTGSVGRSRDASDRWSPTRGEGINLLDISEERMRAIRGKRISMIFQDPFTALNPVMTIREQMEEVLVAHAFDSFSHRKVGEGWDEGQGGRALTPALSRLTPGEGGLHEALARVQLDPTRILASYPHQLSGGQRQRVLIATALLTRPELVLADEPTTALDVLVQKEILDLLFQLQKEMGLSMLLISHNLGLVAQYAQRMAVMKEGQIVEEGDARQIFQSAKHAYTRELLSALPPMVRRPV